MKKIVFALLWSAIIILVSILLNFHSLIFDFIVLLFFVVPLLSKSDEQLSKDFSKAITDFETMKKQKNSYLGLQISNPNNNLNITNLICENEYDYEIIKKTILYGQVDELKIAIKKYNPNIADDTGYSLLGIAVNSNRIEMIKFLIDSGANINSLYITNEKNYRRIVDYFANAWLDLETMKFLVENGLKIFDEDVYFLQSFIKKSKIKLLNSVSNGKLDINSYKIYSVYNKK